MKLTEIKTESHHYFIDERGLKQGERKMWYANGQQWEMCYYRDDKLHGEYKYWDFNGKLCVHAFYIDNERMINFLMNPELYPETPEDKLIFVLKYGNAPFIGEDE